MFLFSLVGTIAGLNRSKDGQTSYLKVQADRIEGAPVRPTDEVGALDIECSTRDMAPGLTLGGRVSIEGTGYMGGALWSPTDGRKPRVIENLRLTVRTIKLSK